jgi:hypothetical protein
METLKRTIIRLVIVCLTLTIVAGQLSAQIKFTRKYGSGFPCSFGFNPLTLISRDTHFLF